MKRELAEAALRSAAKDGCVSLRACREAALAGEMSAREAELTALECGLCPLRYQRNIGTLGLSGQAALLRSSAAVVGCGGLGGWIAELLARAGVGRLTLIDGDSFAESNLNRQLFAVEENLGQLKAEAAALRIASVNSAVETKIIGEYLTEENAARLLDGAGVVMDALDSVSARRVALSECERAGVPFIHGAVAGFYGEAAVLRGGERQLWPPESVPDRGVELSTGNPPFIPTFVASVQCSEAIKILAGLEGGLERSMLWFDLERCDMQRLKI